jgi:hypothetical protein
MYRKNWSNFGGNRQQLDKDLAFTVIKIVNFTVFLVYQDGVFLNHKPESIYFY